MWDQEKRRIKFLIKNHIFSRTLCTECAKSTASKQNWPATHVVWHVNSSCCLMWWASQITLPGFQEHRIETLQSKSTSEKVVPEGYCQLKTFCTCVWIWGIKWPIALPPFWLCLIYFSQVSVIALWGEVDCCACEICALCTCLGCLCSAEQSLLWLSS